MTMIKISNFKIIFIAVFLILLTSCSCAGSVISYEGGFTLTVPDKIKEYLLYPNEVPSLKFDYEGTINVASYSDNNKYFLMKNDNYKVSDALGNHLSGFDDRFINTYELIQTYDDGVAKFGKDELKIDSPERYSREYQRVAWGMDGTRYSYQFRTFMSGGKRYYIYCYSTNITISMELPLMVIKNGESNQLLLLTLPYDTKYEVHPNLKMSSLIGKDTYLYSSYYTFYYPEALKDFNLSEKQEKVKEWYQTYCEGYVENDQFYFIYYGSFFQIDFDKTKTDEANSTEKPAFLISYVNSSH